LGEIIKRTRDGRFIGYYLRFYDGGRRRILASKQPSYAEARRMLLEIEARIARGEVGIPERRGDFPSVAELCERFLREYTRPRLKDLERYRSQARSVLKKALAGSGQGSGRGIGRLSAGAVQQADIVKLRDALSDRFAAGTVYNVLAALSAVFSWAVRSGLAPRNPCKGVERPAAAQALDFLSRDEVRLLLDSAEQRAGTAAGRMLHVAIALAVHTGLRKGELLGLRWIDLDLETRRLTVARSYDQAPKSGSTRHLRIPAVLHPILSEWRRVCPQSPEGLVLPLGHNAAKAAGREAMLGLPRLMRESGLRPVPHPWHLLRHTFASHFVMQGGNILALQKVLGHADIKVTLIYAHLAPDFLDREMDKVRF
jgi:integrase